MIIHLLDMGTRAYGDCTLVIDGERRMLVDGGHPGDDRPGGGAPPIQDQLSRLLGETAPFELDLLVVTHCHSDHIGCLPELYARGLIRPRNALVADERLGFGRSLDDARLAEYDPVVNEVVAALREEPLASDRTDDELATLLADAATLESRYVGLLSAMENDGISVVRHGRDEGRAMLADVDIDGLAVIGPSQEQLVICGEAIRQFTREASDVVRNLRRSDAQANPIALYRAVSGSLSVDGFLSDSPGKGAALNDQSIVLAVGTAPDRALLSADMQFAKPEVGGLQPAMKALRAAVAEEGPYAFAKLPHHGSYNGVDAGLMDEWDVGSVAVSTGRGHPAHPSRVVLDLLASRVGRTPWARTDRNGIVTVTLENGSARLDVEHGDLNDAAPNVRSDTQETTGPVVNAKPTGAGEAPGPAAVVRTTRSQAHGVTEVTARIPSGVRKVTLTIEIEPSEEIAGDPASVAPQTSGETTRAGASSSKAWNLANGRELPKLLFVTHAERLGNRVGAEVLAAMEAAIEASGKHDLLRLDDARDVLAQVHEASPGFEGIVLLGGYDVVPSWRFDVLPPDLRARLGSSTGDDDDFLVWSDQPYADVDGDGMAEVPVSRIPDGGSAELLRRALECDMPTANSRFGIRNSARPFAEAIFKGVPGNEAIRVCGPVQASDYSPADIRHGASYLMLHGSDVDGTSFWGESGGRLMEGMSVGNLGPMDGATVFAGCCWGALVVTEPARIAGAMPEQRSPSDSIALSCLLHGARAFIGCTGTHYSPAGDRPDFFGGPMHAAFWERLSAGSSPARALHEAKIEYVGGMPHGRKRASEVAIEYKILRQFTCLGLGW